jgi:hypothetical protein
LAEVGDLALDEIRRFFDHMPSVKYRAVLMTCDDAGLCCASTESDCNWDVRAFCALSSTQVASICTSTYFTIEG